ncbi:pilus assembly protein TadG-related protein [Nocardiopsis sp. NPDC049922]|uniref:pilus assembly protein TadG-related protein n=1 Tax=Nocardiopsis sp. NPDC049922 TaxID=3155157 RepID=UPI003405F536
MTRLAELWRRGDQGQASVFLLMLVPVVMIVFALVWEAGQMLVAKAELLSVAHSAARAGAHQLDGAASLAGGSPVLDAAEASQAALDHLGSAGLGGQVVVEDNRVVVLAHTTHTPDLLPIGAREIEAEAAAAALQPPLG